MLEVVKNKDKWTIILVCPREEVLKEVLHSMDVVQKTIFQRDESFKHEHNLNRYHGHVLRVKVERVQHSAVERICKMAFGKEDELREAKDA